MAGSEIVAEGLPGFRVSTLRAASSTAQNSLEAGFQVNTMQDGALVYVQDQFQTYRWFPSSLAAPSDPTIVIPLGQSLSVPGRWIATGVPSEIHYVYSTSDLPDPVDRERILTDGIWIFMANVSDAAFDGGGSPDPTAANSLVIPAGGKVELKSGQLSTETTTSMWGYRTNSDRAALRIEQSAIHEHPFFVWNQEHAPGTPSVQTDAGVVVTISDWMIGLASTGPSLFQGSTTLSDCTMSTGVEFGGGFFFRMDNCQHGPISITGTGADDNWSFEADNCRMPQGTPGVFMTIPEGVGFKLGGVTLSNCHMPLGSTSRLVDFGNDYNKEGAPYLHVTDCSGGSPSLGIVPSGGVSIRGFQRQSADGGFVGFDENTAKVYVRESFDETGAKLLETPITV